MYNKSQYDLLLSKQKVSPDSKIEFPSVNFDNMKFDGECGKIFNQSKATKRDLILFSHQHNYKWIAYKKEMFFSLSLIRKTLPDVSLTIMTKGNLPKDFIEMCKSFNVHIEETEGYTLWNSVNSRIPLALNYLKEHEKEFDRVAWSDLRDMYILRDIFSTVGMDELVWMTECKSDTFCYKHRSDKQKLHYYWMIRFFGKKEADRLTTFDSVTLNGGFGIGGIHKMIQMLTIWTENIQLKFVTQWGYDQTLLNYLYYNGYFKDINLQIERCTQRMCFGPELIVDYYTQSFILKDVQCSPVLMHKDFPDNMRKVFLL